MPSSRRPAVVAVSFGVLWVFALGGDRGAQAAEANNETELCGSFNTAGLNRLNEFTSPNFPNLYPPNTECIRIVHAPPGYDILFRFGEPFRIETSYEDSLDQPRSITPNCPNDYLEIRDGRYSFSPLIGRFCGLRAPDSEVRVRSGYAWLNFHSDALIEERGFGASYEFVRNGALRPTPPPDCHFSYILHLDGYVNVSAMRDFYTNGLAADQPLECIFQIRVPNWLRVAIFMEQFELAAPNQCAQNHLEIYAGATARQPLKRYCGIIATHTYTAESVIFIRTFMRSAFHAENSRLRILFSSYLAQRNCSEHSLFECGDDICIPPSLVCNGRPNCLYQSDETQCDLTDYPLRSILHNNYLQLVFLLFLLALVVTGLGFYYRPWRRNGLTESTLEIDAKEGTPLTPLPNKKRPPPLTIPNSFVSQIKPPTPQEATDQSPLQEDGQPPKENGFCHRGTSVSESLANAEVWRTADSSTATPSLIVETLSDETSFVTMNV